MRHLPARAWIHSWIFILPIAAWSGCSGSLTVPAPAGRGADASAPARTVAGLRSALDALFDEPQYANAFWGVRIERPDGALFYERNSRKQFAPASNMKVFTSAAALDILGPDFMYETRLEAVGTVASDGVLAGDLLIVGSGDPSLGAWHPDKTRDSRWLLAEWVGRIKAAGIQRVSGDVVGDGRCFTNEGFSDCWNYGDLMYWYAAATSGLAMEENGYRCIIRPGAKVGDPASIEVVPATSYITIVNQTRTVEAGGESNADSTWQETEGNARRFIGTIAIDKKQIDERGSIYDGARYAAHLLKEQLERQGIIVEGKAANVRALADADRLDKAPTERRRVIATCTSPPMSELVKVINKPSHNFFADQILRTMAIKKTGEGSFANGQKVIRAWLKEIGAPEPDNFQTYDGSGLARNDLVQPQQVCHVLRHMLRSDKAGKAFYESLPIAGVDGTIESRMKDDITRGKVHAKTGYISHVRALSGYAPDASGGEFVFSMICNQFTIPVSRVNATQDAAVTLLATWQGAH